MSEIIQFHRGNRAEYLARFALSAFGYVVPVPRETDRFFVDLFLHLAQPGKKKMKVTGPTLAFQIKSPSQRIIRLTGRRLRLFLDELEFPFFIGQADITREKLDVYSTHRRFGHRHYRHVRKLILRLEPEPTGFKNVQSSIQHDYYLGSPIASLNMRELDGTKWNKIARKLHSVLATWASLDLLNLGWRTMEMPMYLSPDSYRENEPLDIMKLRYRYIQGPSLRLAAARHLEHITGVLADYFGSQSSSSENAKLAKACEQCRKASLSIFTALDQKAPAR